MNRIRNPARGPLPPAISPATGTNRSLLRQLADVTGFFTIMPVPARGSLADTAAAGYLLPVVAAAVGIVAGTSAWALLYIFSPPLSAALVLALMLVITGFHHSDGLADVGDAIMARGDATRRIEVLKDSTVGTGAVMTVFVTYLVTWVALAEAISAREGIQVIFMVAIAEIAARFGLLVVARVSPASHSGSGSIFISALRGWRGAVGITLSLALMALLAIFMPMASLLGGLGALLAALLVALVARRWFGGAGGDILGAAVEWGRMAALLGIAASMSF